jgi:hypothetical protein
VAALLASLSGAQPAAAGDRQTVRASLTTQLPGTPTGNRLEVEWHNPADPKAKPPAIDTIVIQLPRGSRWDFSTLPQCKASDAELMARGRAACSEATRVSTGHALVDTGSPGIFPRFLNVNTVMFNNGGEMIGLGETVEMPFRTVVRTKMERERATIPMADNPGGPPDNRSSFKTMMAAAAPIVRGDRAYARTGPCPASGVWTHHYTFIYHDGVRQTETTQWPCKRSANPCLARRLPIRRRGIGPIHLGRGRAQLLALPVRPPSSRGAVTRWCADRSRGGVRAVFRNGRAALVLTSVRGHGNRGVWAGRSARRLATAYPRRRQLARGLFRAGPRSRMLIGTRAGKVRYVAIADRRLLADRSALIRSVRQARR